MELEEALVVFVGDPYNAGGDSTHVGPLKGFDRHLASLTIIAISFSR